MRETENNKRYKAAMQGVGMQNVKMQQEAADKGSLQVNVTSSVNSYPISEARISISYTGVPENTLEQLVTDSSGQKIISKMWRPAKFMPPGPQIRFGQTFLRLCLLRSIAFIPNGIETKGMILRSLHLQHSIISGYRKEMYMKAFP